MDWPVTARTQVRARPRDDRRPRAGDVGGRRPVGQPGLRHRRTARSATWRSPVSPPSGTSPCTAATGSAPSSPRGSGSTATRRCPGGWPPSGCCARSSPRRGRPADGAVTSPRRWRRCGGPRAGAAWSSSSPTSSATADWERPLRALSLRHELLAIEVVDPRELELPDVGLLTVVDPETGQTLEVPTGNAEFRARFAAGRRGAAGADRGRAAPGGRRSPAAAHRPGLADGRRPLRRRPPARRQRRGLPMTFQSPAVAARAARCRRAGRALRGAAAAPEGLRGAVHQRRAARLAGAQAPGLAAAPGVRRRRARAGRPGGVPGRAEHRGAGAARAGHGDHGRRRVAVDEGHRHRSPTASGPCRSAAKKFVDVLPGRINLGLVSFAGTATHAGARPPPTAPQVRAAIDHLHLAESTAIGEAIFTSLSAIENFQSSLQGTAEKAAAGADRAALRRLQHRRPRRHPGDRGGARPPASRCRRSRSAPTTARSTSTARRCRCRSTGPRCKHDRRRDRRQLQRGGHRAASSSRSTRDLGSQIGYATEPKDVSYWFVRGGVLLALVGACLSLLWTNRLV